MWKWSLKLKDDRKGSIQPTRLASGMNMHELKVTTSTIHKDQSTVIMSFKHLHIRTRRERAKRAHALYIAIYINCVVLVWLQDF